jgi:HK97 family phage major capsid protein
MTVALNGSKRLDWLKREMDNALTDVETITSRAADEDRELSDSEVSTCESRRSRIADLEPQIEVEADLAERSAKYAGLVSRIGSAPTESPLRGTVVRSGEVSQEPVYRSAGEYLTDYILSRSTQDGSQQAKDRFERYLQRAVAHQTTVQNPGLLPVPILGPIFTQQNQRRPAIEATTRRPLPGPGKTFQRPKISQYTTAGPQSAEKAELPSRPMLIDPVTVTKQTYGGTINLSWQDRDWTEPAIMDLLVSDLAASYFQATDAAFCTYFGGSVTQTQALATPDGKGVVEAIYAATGTVFGQTNGMPDTLWVAPNVWGALGSLTDTTGRQLFPTVNPMNAMGSIQPTSMTGSVAGMQMVVDKNLAAGTAILGDSTFIETYETIGGQVSVVEPSVLGTQMAFYGYIAWLNLEPKAFVKLTGVPVLPLSENPTTEEEEPTKTYAKKGS